MEDKILNASTIFILHELSDSYTGTASASGTTNYIVSHVDFDIDGYPDWVGTDVDSAGLTFEIKDISPSGFTIAVTNSTTASHSFKVDWKRRGIVLWK